MARTTKIIDNVVRKGTFLRISYLNWAEAAIAAFISAGIISLIPFIPSIKRALIILVGVTVFVFVLRGIKNRSYIQILFAEFNFRRKRRRLHLRAPNYKKSKKVEVINNESYIETIANYLRRRNDEFVEKHRTK